MEFLALFFTVWNFHLILPNIWILALFLQTLEFLSYPTIANIEILALSFQTMEFWPIIYTPCFLISSFKTLGFWPYFYKHWNYDFMIPKNGILALFFINTGILTLSFQTSEFSYCPSKHWNSGPIFYTLHFDFILRNIGIIDLSFKPLEFWPSINTHWNCEVIPPNIAILALYLYKLKFSSYPFKRWNSDPIFIHIGIVTLAFQWLALFV